MPDPQPVDLMPIHFLRSGTHTDRRGTRVTFSDDDIRSIAAVYDPALHEAPIVVGHPRDDAPAYGWVQRIEADADGATALAGQIDPAFADALRAGRFKKVSAAIYLPDSPANPKPGGYYLRHVGLLGAMAPAIKGLKQTQFGDGGGYVTVDFGEVSGFTVAGLFRSLRDWIIGRDGVDAADKALPGYLVDSLRDDAVMPSPADPSAAPAYSETSQRNLRGERREQVGHGDPQQPGAPAVSEDPAKTAATLSQGDAMSEEIAAKAAALAEREKALAAQEAAFAERRRRDEAAAAIAVANHGGIRILPVDVPAMTALLAQLDDATADAVFGEGGAAGGPRTWLASWLARLPVQVDLAERSAAAGDPLDADNPEAIAAAAQAFQAAEAAAGRTVRIDDAVRHVVTSLS